MQLFFAHPTSPVVRGHVLAIRDPRDPNWSSQTKIFTPKTSPFSLAPFQEGRDQSYSFKIPISTVYFSKTASPKARGQVSASWDPRDPHQSPQTTIFTPETSPFSLQCCVFGFWIMAPNPPNRQFGCINFIPNGGLSHLWPEDKLLSFQSLMSFPLFWKWDLSSSI